jgi:translation initiation factor IF-3
VPEVRLVGPNGEQVGIVRVEDALRVAQEADLDLVEVAPDARPPVCKLMDYGKFKYESAMKARDARRNQTNTVLKEIRFRLKIDPHDYGTKKGHVERFLKAGDKVKVMIMFRGREQSRPEMGMRLLQRLADDVAELGFVESSPRLDGRNMIMVIGPTKKKAETKVEPRRKPREEGAPGAPEPLDEALAAESAPAAAEEAAPVVDVAAEPAPAPVAAVAQPEAPPAAVVPAAPAASPAPVASPAPAPASRPARPAAAPRTPAAPRVPAPRQGPAAPAAPRPTSAPQPAATPSPSATPRPAAAPRPTPVPRPSAAPRPTGTPKPPAPRPSRPSSPEAG